MSTKVAVVTGGNKGIGFAIVRGLCKRFDGVVYLTSRDEARGRKAVTDLEKEGLHPKYHQLDITDKKSLEAFRDYIQEKYGGIDVLINNAATIFQANAPEPFGYQAEQTIHVNVFCIILTGDILFPILRNGARVINLTSSVGHLQNIPSERLRNRFKNPNLTVDQLRELMNEYVDAAKKGTHAEEWGDSFPYSYTISKVGVAALTFIQQRQLNDRDIKVNAVHPGYVDTDLTNHQGPLTIDQGAAAPLYMALDADDSVKGQFMWSDKKIVNWEVDMPNYH